MEQETATLEDLIARRGVTAGTVGLLLTQLPDLLAALEEEGRGTAVAPGTVAISPDGKRLWLRGDGDGQGEMMKGYGLTLLAALSAVPAKMGGLRKIALACADGRIESAAELRLAIERHDLRRLHAAIAAALAALLALLYFINSLQN